MKISVDIEITRSKEKVWKAITDIDNAEKMVSGIIDLRVIHRPENGLIGLKWQETRKIFGKESTETMWITEAVENQYYCTRAENHGAIYVTKMAIKELDGKSVLIMSFSGTAESMFIRIVSAIMSVFVKNSMIKMLKKDLEDIKKYVEEN